MVEDNDKIGLKIPPIRHYVLWMINVTAVIAVFLNNDKMKTYLVFLVLVMTTQSLFSQNDSTKTQSVDSVVYTCPMHPDIVSGKPGKCPKCAMDLVQKNPSSSEHKMNMMMCPMHGMVGMEHKHDEQKKDNMKMMKGVGIGMGVMMVLMLIFLSTN